MVKFWEQLQPEHITWIVAQKIFWVATFLLSPDGRMNISPKGVAGTFHVVNERKVWYGDLTGSGTHPFDSPHWKLNVIPGIETISHGGPAIRRNDGLGLTGEKGLASQSSLPLIQHNKRVCVPAGFDSRILGGMTGVQYGDIVGPSSQRWYIRRSRVCCLLLPPGPNFTALDQTL